LEVKLTPGSDTVKEESQCPVQRYGRVDAMLPTRYQSGAILWHCAVASLFELASLYHSPDDSLTSTQER
jgi:hypothetical protein